MGLQASWEGGVPVEKNLEHIVQCMSLDGYQKMEVSRASAHSEPRVDSELHSGQTRPNTRLWVQSSSIRAKIGTPVDSLSFVRVSCRCLYVGDLLTVLRFSKYRHVQFHSWEASGCVVERRLLVGIVYARVAQGGVETNIVYWLEALSLYRQHLRRCPFWNKNTEFWEKWPISVIERVTLPKEK